MQIDDAKLRQLLKAAAQEGATIALVLAGISSHRVRFISQNKAFRQFGRINVITWRKRGDITPKIHGNSYLYDIDKLTHLSLINEMYGRDSESGDHHLATPQPYPEPAERVESYC
jgi:hypothetical protein